MLGRTSGRHFSRQPFFPNKTKWERVIHQRDAQWERPFRSLCYQRVLIRQSLRFSENFPCFLALTKKAAERERRVSASGASRAAEWPGRKHGSGLTKRRRHYSHNTTVCAISRPDRNYARKVGTQAPLTSLTTRVAVNALALMTNGPGNEMLAR